MKYSALYFRSVALTIFYEGILLTGTGIIFFTAVSLFKLSWIGTLLLAIVIVAIDVSLDISWLLIRRKYSQWRIWYFAITATSIGFLHFFLFASLIYWLVKAYNDAGDLGLPVFDIGVFLMLSAFALGIYGIWNSYRTRIKNYTIKLENLPKFWHNKKIVMLADLHLGNIRGVKFINSVVELVKKEKPDLVLIPGDYFDGTPADLASLAAPLENIKAKHGIYFCDGNHEAFGHDVRFVHALRKAGVKILNDDWTDVEGLQIVGVGYLSTHGLRHKFREVLQKINFDRNKPSILIKHVPSGLKIAAKEKISLMVSGHTHKAQLVPFNIVTKIIFEGFDYGYKKYGLFQVIITSGVGTWGPPQRVGTQSEIVSIILQPAD